MVEASAIDPAVAAERGYKTVTTKSELTALGFSVNQARVPAMLIPVYGVAGNLATYQSRPNTPRIKDGKPLKYETPAKTRMVLDVPRRCRERGWLGNPAVPLIVTEGARKADAAVSAGYCAIALLGVWNFRGTNEHGGKTVLADWDEIALNDGRDVFIIFDSDVVTKLQVRNALLRQKGVLELRGAKVRVVTIPAGDGGAKVGLDDYLAAGGTIPELFAAAGDVLDVLDSAEVRDLPFATTRDGYTVQLVSDGEGGIREETIAFFTAQIVEDVIEDDGAETRRSFRLRGTVGGRAHEFLVPTAEFNAMNWPLEHLGPKAIVRSGFGAREKLREAVQLLSPKDIPERRIYLHLGWVTIDGKPAFLHAGGALGAEGPIPGVQLKLEHPLDRFLLPAPPKGQTLVDAIHALLRLLDGLASDEVMFPLFALPFGVLVAAVRACIHLTGGTGVRKSELVALCQRLFGATLTVEQLASWSSTANYLEMLAFHAKDSVLAVDDFCPTGTATEVQHQHREADRFLRAVANGSSRSRMRQDTSLRAPKPPRCSVYSTGEDIPNGQSLRARMLVAEVAKGEVNLAKLTECQHAAPEFSKVTAAFICWAAPQLDRLRAEFHAEVERRRDLLLQGGRHGRTATVGAELITSLVYFARFAVEAGALSQEVAIELCARGESAIRRLLNLQGNNQLAANPAHQFVCTVAAALRAGDAHVVAHRVGGVPTPTEVAGALGWRPGQGLDPSERGDAWRPMGPAIGWVDVDEDAIYFDPTPAYRAVQRQLDASPTRLTINERTLWKRMEEEGLLASHEPGRHTAKLRVGRATHNTLHLSLSLLLGESRTSRTSPHVTPDAAALVRTEDVFPERTGPVPDVPDPSGEIENTSASAREGAETGRFEFAGDEAWRIHDA